MSTIGFRHTSPRRRPTPEQISYRMMRGRLTIAGDEYELAMKRLGALKRRYQVLLASGRGADAEQLRQQIMVPLEELIATLHERVKSLEARIAEFEAETDRAQEGARIRILTDELRRRQQRLQAAEFEVEKAREAMREIRAEIEADA